MMPYHKVNQGEHLTRIAYQGGFASYQVLYNESKNASFKQGRPDPNLLYPGDVVFMPDKQTKEEPGETEQRHRFRLNKDELKLRIEFRTFDWEPFLETTCELHGSEPTQSHTTDSNGRVEQSITPDIEDLFLMFESALPNFELMLPVKVGHLDPLTEQSGQAGRLRNLSYFTGAIPVEDEAAFLSAVEEFQCDHQLNVDGICGPSTQSKLKEMYGC